MSTTRPTASTVGNKEKETKNAVRFTTGWGVMYIPKAQLEKLGNPDSIQIIIESHDG